MPPHPDTAAILTGLARHKLKERRRYIPAAAESDDPAVAAALEAMYATRNAIRDDVLAAMKTQNARNRGAFAAGLDRAWRAEHARLVAEPSPQQVPYLLEQLWYTTRAPHGLAPFAAWVRELATAEPPLVPRALSRELAAVADLALAATGDDAALTRAIAAWHAGHLAEHADLAAICVARRSPRLWQPLLDALHETPERDDWLDLAAEHLDLAVALGRLPDRAVVARYSERAAVPFAEPAPQGDHHA